ncbi:MAG: hypothetical protein NW208_18550 [Bryobacter sp.]|nr:hypothetical protein [Bryobacter sp.]
MSFETTYQLVAPVADSKDALTYKALIKMTGEEVYIHIVRPDAADLFATARKHNEAPGFGPKEILEVVQDGARSYLVTRPLPKGATLRGWLSTLEQVKTPDPFAAAGAWQVGGAPPASPDMPTMTMPTFAAPPPPPPPPPPPTPPPVDAKTEPGEFTRMFQAVQPTGAPAAAPTSGAPLPATPFSPPSAIQAPAMQAPPIQAAPKDEPGEFTRMFQSPLMQPAGTGISGVPNPLANPLPPPPSEQVGEFTRMFKGVNAPDVMAAPPPPAAPQAGPGDFTRLLQAQPAPGTTAPSGSAPASFAAPPQQGFAAPPQQGFAPPAQQGFAPPPPQGFAPPPSQPASGFPPAPGATPYGAPPPSAANPSAPPPGNAGANGGGFQVGRPQYSGPSVYVPGVSGPTIDSQGNIRGPVVGAPSFNQGTVSGSPSISSKSIGLSDVANLFGGGNDAPAQAGPVAHGPLSAAAGPVDPQALSGGGDGATAMFRAPAAPASPAMPATPAAPAGPGEFTRMMQAPPAASGPAVGVPVPKENQVAAAPAPIFSQPVGAPPPAAPAPAAAASMAPAEAPKPKGPLGGMSPLLIAATVVIVLLIAALIYVMVTTGR